MYSFNQLKTLVSCGRDPARSLPFRRGFLLIPLILVSFALHAQAIEPAAPVPSIDRGGGNTSDGNSALNGLTSGRFNSAFGFFSQLVLTDAKFNTACGAGTLLLNNANSQTAVGAGALFGNTSGANNTAVGAFALFSNTTPVSAGDSSFNNAFGANALVFNATGSSNNAFGESALFNCIKGSGNTALGDVALGNDDSDGAGLGSANSAVGAGALFSNIDGDSNNAFGFNALGSATSDSAGDSANFNQAIGVDALQNLIGATANGADGNVAIGDSAGSNVIEGGFNVYIGFGVGGAADESNTIRIGDTSDVACFIGGISGQTSDSGAPVMVGTDGKLGTAPAGSPFSMKEALKQQNLVKELKATTERQAARIALQEGQINTLTAALKQQGELIQKVSAQLEMVRPTPRVVENR